MIGRNHVQVKSERSDGARRLDDNGAMGAGTQLSSWDRAAAKLRAVINRLAPMGYEDEAGFHYGSGPAHNYSRYPAPEPNFQ